MQNTEKKPSSILNLIHQKSRNFHFISKCILEQKITIKLVTCLSVANNSGILKHIVVCCCCTELTFEHKSFCLVIHVAAINFIIMSLAGTAFYPKKHCHINHSMIQIHLTVLKFYQSLIYTKKSVYLLESYATTTNVALQ